MMIALVVLLFGGLGYLILLSRLAEHRIDAEVRTDSGLGRNLASDRRRWDRDNYSPAAQRLLRWASVYQVALLLAAIVCVGRIVAR